MAIESEKDVVAMPSLRVDGNPDQTEGYKVLDPATGEHADAAVFDEFREKTQETVLPATDSEASEALPDNVEGTPVDESTGVPGTEEAQAQVAADTAAAADADAAPDAEEEPKPRRRAASSE
jgi:hypothetical protein